MNCTLQTPFLSSEHCIDKPELNLIWNIAICIALLFTYITHGTFLSFKCTDLPIITLFCFNAFFRKTMSCEREGIFFFKKLNKDFRLEKRHNNYFEEAKNISL